MGAWGTNSRWAWSSIRSTAEAFQGFVTGTSRRHEPLTRRARWTPEPTPLNVSAVESSSAPPVPPDGAKPDGPGEPPPPDVDRRGAVTEALSRFSSGESKAVDDLVPLVYDELRSLARSHMRAEQVGHTLATTALVHEAYLRLFGTGDVDFEDRRHFFGAASRAMRRVLVDHARARSRAKRGGGAPHVPLHEVLLPAGTTASDVLDLDEALTRLEVVSARQARLVEHRFFAGFTIEEAAEALGISVATAKRDWALARAWLNVELGAT